MTVSCVGIFFKGNGETMKRVGDILKVWEHTAVTAASSGSQSPILTPRSEASCPICKGRGYLTYDAPPGDPNFSKVVPCRCTEARLAADRTRNLAAVSNLGALSRLTFDTFLPDGAGLPPALRANLRNAYELSLNFARSPEGWLTLLGGYGCGKTHLAAAIANFRLALGHEVLFVVVPDLLDYLRAAYAPNSEIAFDERIETIRTAPLLILDDLGAHSSTPWAAEKLYQILNHRYNSRLPTVITSNQGLEELDPRITSRMTDPDFGIVFTILAPDFRAGHAGGGVFDRSGRALNALARHADQTFENFSLRTHERMDPEQRDSLRRALALAREFAETPRGWLIFHGTYGCGKTHLAAAIANYQITREERPIPMFVVVPELLDYLRATFSPSSPTTFDRAFDQVKTAPLLILDDLGTESATPWAREKLFQLLNYRYATRQPTVITTFNTPEELDPRLASRMSDQSRCTSCHITAPGYRGSAAARPADRVSKGAAETPVDRPTRSRRQRAS